MLAFLFNKIPSFKQDIDEVNFYDNSSIELLMVETEVNGTSGHCHNAHFSGFHNVAN